MARTKTGFICTKRRQDVLLDLPIPASASVRVGTCTSLTDDAVVFMEERIEAGSADVALTLPAGALVLVTQVDPERKPVRRWLYVVSGATVDTVRHANGEDAVRDLARWLNAARFRIQSAALPEQAGVRAAVLAEVAGTAGSEVFQHRDAEWLTWAKWTPGAAKNGTHVERDCTVVETSRYIWVVGSRIARKVPAHVQHYPHGFDESYAHCASVEEAEAELRARDDEARQAEDERRRRHEELESIATEMRSQLVFGQSPVLGQITPLSGRERAIVIQHLLPLAPDARRRLAAAIESLTDEVHRRRLLGDLRRAAPDS